MGSTSVFGVFGPCVQPGDPAAPFSSASRFTAPSLKAARLIASAQCDGPNACPAQGLANVGRFSIHRAQIGLEDAFPPVFRSPPSGGLMDATASSVVRAPSGSTARIAVVAYEPPRSSSTGSRGRERRSRRKAVAGSRSAIPFHARRPPPA